MNPLTKRIYSYMLPKKIYDRSGLSIHINMHMKVIDFIKKYKNKGDYV